MFTTNIDIREFFFLSGILFLYLSPIFFISSVVGLLFGEYKPMGVLFVAGIFSLIVGIFFKELLGNKPIVLKKKTILATIAFVWLFFPMLGGFVFDKISSLSFLDGYFEAMSALTTTGLTMYKYPIALPKSIILFRSLLSWIGGIGIISLAIIGATIGYRIESSLLVAEGRDEHLKPNLKNSIRMVFIIYTGITLFGAGLLFLSGMDVFNSINYSMSAISTTGFESNYLGLKRIANLPILLSLIVIMTLGAISFFVHYEAIKMKSIEPYKKDIESKALIFLWLLSFFILIPLMKFRILDSFFYSNSALTCGGFAYHYPIELNLMGELAKVVLLGLMIVGGSVGSTAGGIKLERFVIFLKSLYWRIKEGYLPKNVIFSRKIGDKSLKTKEILDCYVFIAFYLLIVFVSAFIISLHGYSFVDSLFEVASAQGNAGISIGITEPTLPITIKVLLIFNMWVGRLEIIPLFALLSFIIMKKERR